MAKHRKNRTGNSRDAPVQKSFGAFLCTQDAYKILCADGYRPLSQCPEVQMAVNVYADAIASMTLHLMRNTDKGDVRIKDGLSRRVDIEPNPYMTRHQFIHNLVRVLMLEGGGNQITVPVFSGGLLERLEPVPPSAATILAPEHGDMYRVMIGGRAYAPDEVLHFVLNPDPEAPYRGQGYTIALRDVVKSLRQTTTTKNALMESPKPSLIVKVDGLSEQLQTKEGRAQFAGQYLSDTEDGRPWFIPAEAMTIEQIKPMTLNDLAIDKNLELDKRSIAALLGVPPYMLGVGEFKAQEYDWFVSVRIMSIARIIEQELTRKLLYSPDMYWRFNNHSLLAYDMERIASIGKEMVDRMAMRRNEWRNLMGLAPDPEMDELLILENYLRQNKGEAVPVGGEADDGKE